jgi:mono/diheme cytochrome c family protein
MQGWIMSNRSFTNQSNQKTAMKTLFLITAGALLAMGDSASAADGRAIYAKECAKCHGDDGKGDTKMGKKLKVKDLTVELAKLSDAQIAKSITDGVVEGDKVRMKPIKTIAAADVDAVVKYVKSLKK